MIFAHHCQEQEQTNNCVGVIFNSELNESILCKFVAKFLTDAEQFRGNLV
jgi:hypothetical protein